MSGYSDSLEALDRIVDRGGDADDVLREVVRVLAERYDYAAIKFVERGALVPGPRGGHPERVDYGVADLLSRDEGGRARDRAGNDGDKEFLERVAALVSPYCLVGWDTGGERWSP